MGRTSSATVFERIVEQFKKRERGIERQMWVAWHERQQAALREGRAFTEPPPGYPPKAGGDGRESTDS